MKIIKKFGGILKMSVSHLFFFVAGVFCFIGIISVLAVWPDAPTDEETGGWLGAVFDIAQSNSGQLVFKSSVLKLKPNTSASCTDDSDEGAMYYNEDQDMVFMCKGAAGGWQEFRGPQGVTGSRGSDGSDGRAGGTSPSAHARKRGGEGPGAGRGRLHAAGGGRGGRGDQDASRDLCRTDVVAFSSLVVRPPLLPAWRFRGDGAHDPGAAGRLADLPDARRSPACRAAGSPGDVSPHLLRRRLHAPLPGAGKLDLPLAGRRCDLAVDRWAPRRKNGAGAGTLRQGLNELGRGFPQGILSHSRMGVRSETMDIHRATTAT